MWRADIINFLAAAVALRTGLDLEVAAEHYRAHWPGLFQFPAMIDPAKDELVAVSARWDKPRTPD